MSISNLNLTNLGPFAEVAFEFDPQINVFAGPNNSGKTTALLALAEITIPSFYLPDKLIRNHKSRFHFDCTDQKLLKQNATLLYSTPGGRYKWKKSNPKAQKSLQNILGYTVFVPALRWSTDFRSGGPRQSTKQTLKDGTGTSASTPHKIRMSGSVDNTGSSMLRDADIVQEIIDLDYRSYRQTRPGMRNLIEKIASLASEITEGFPIEFVKIAEDKSGLYPEFRTSDGVVPLNVLSQGTQSLLQWLARLILGYAKHYDYPTKLDSKPGIFIIDEIDAHLHPSWQRRIIPAISKAFPSLQIFCSTHSPLMLAGLKAGQIQLLSRDKKGRVTVSRNESDIVGWTTDEIMTTFLGVDNATDWETEKSLVRLQELRGRKRLAVKEKKELEKLRESVNQRLLGGPGMGEIDALAEKLKKTLGENGAKKAATVKKSKKKATKVTKKKTGSKFRRAAK